MKKKRICSLALVFTLVLTLVVPMGTPVLAVGPTTVHVTDWTGLKSAVTAAVADGSETDIVLDADITAGSQYILSGSRNIVIVAGSGTTITCGASFNGTFFNLNDASAQLTLHNVTLDGNAVARYSALVDISAGTFTLDGAIITNVNDGSVSASDGVAARLHGASAAMYMKNNAAVTNVINTAGYGAIDIDAGTLYMDGGSVTGNHTGFGGIYNASTVDLQGAPNISGNLAWDGGDYTIDLNLYLAHGALVNVPGTLSNTMPIGVATEDSPTSGSPVNITTAINTTDLSAYFTSDNASYNIINSGSDSSQVLQLAVPTASSSTIDVGHPEYTLPTDVIYDSTNHLFTIDTGANSRQITVTGSTTANTIAVAADVSNLTLVLDGISINLSGTYSSAAPIDIKSSAAVTIQLGDNKTNTLTAGDYNSFAAGLSVPAGAAVTIKGDTGVLNATGGNFAAGIGGGGGAGGGNITIDGGVINATGTFQGAGIGGGGGSYSSNGGDGGDVTINGGTVTADASGMCYSAGIGGGAASGSGSGGGGGTVKVTGGTVYAKGSNSGGAGIGGGGSVSGTAGAGGAVTIGGSAHVTAVSSGAKPAIDAASGTGSVINATFSTAPGMSDTYLLSSGGTSLTLPGFYRNFAFNTSAASETITVYNNPSHTSILGSVIQSFDYSPNIASGTPSVTTAVQLYTPARVAVKKDGAGWATATPVIQLSTKPDLLADAILGTRVGNVYTFTSLDPTLTYYVWDADGTNNHYTGQTVSANSLSPTVNYYTVTLAKGTGIDDVTGGGVYLSGSGAAIGATISSGYTFNHWTSSSGGTFANAGSASTTFTAAGAATVTAAATLNSTAIDVSLTSQALPTGVTYDSTNHLFTIGTGANNSTITVTGDNAETTNTIAVASGVTGLTLILDGVSITSPSGGGSPIDLAGDANVTLTLAAGTVNTLTAASASLSAAGIHAAASGSLTATLKINGTGRLDATGCHAAGIGGSSPSGTGESGGNITIDSGIINAMSGYGGAGIGSGSASGGSGGQITINGGTVTATCSGGSGAGIGGGANDNGGTITITGGTVTATGDYRGAGIGGGGGGYSTSGDGGGGVISITNAMVTAIGGTAGGAGIGGGDVDGGSTSGTITIGESAVVTAVSSASGGNPKPAIDAASGSTDSVINAQLDTAISGSVTTYLKCGGNVLALPASYRNFAFTASSASQIDAYSDSDCAALLGHIVTVSYASANIPLLAVSASPTAVKLLAVYSATVTVNKDNAAWTSSTPMIQLSTAPGSLAGAVTGTLSGGVYSFAGLTAATYYVWDTTNSYYTDQTVTSSTNATVDYYTVTLTAGTGIGSTSGDGTYLKDSNATINATVSDGYAWSKWTQTAGSTDVTPEQNYTITGIDAAQSYTANATLNAALTGTVSFTVNPTTGDVTASATGGNVDSRALTYSWTGVAASTGATATPTLGSAATCIVTASGAAGSIQATTTVYKVAVTTSGNTGTDDTLITNAYGKVGDSVSIAYTLDSSGTASNTLTYSGAATNPEAVSTTGSGTSAYVIASGDATGGTVHLTATFAHAALPALSGTVNLIVNQSTGAVTANVSGGNVDSRALTYSWTGVAASTGATATPTLGSAATCIVTASGATGSIQATTTVYKVAITTSGNTGTDDTLITNAYGKVGGSVSIAYTLDSSGTASNTLTYSGAASAPAAINAAGSGTSTYEIASGDATSGTISLTATFAHNSGSGGGGGSNVSPANNNTTVIVDGENHAIGTENKNDTTTTATVDQNKLADEIDGASDSSSVIFPVSTNNSVTAQLVVKNVEDMAQKEMILTVKTGGVSYNLKTVAIDTADITAALGTTHTEDIPFNVTISNSDAAAVGATVSGATLILSPVEFTVTAVYNGKTVTVDTFSSFVDRTVEITAEQAARITTAVVIKPDGTAYHVPTKVTEIDGKYYAVINSLTNSTYSVVWHPVEFADVTNHWAKDAINDMGSRMVVAGVGSNNYEPDRDITRAEFAAIVVRALGLDTGMGSSSFTDVASNAWYYGYIQTAVGYGIITGYGDGTFGPNDAITREQAMTMIARAMKITKLAPTLTDSQVTSLLSKYTDAAGVSDYAKASVAACIDTGVILGRPNSTVASKDFITRAEVAVSVERMLQKSNLI